MNDQTAQLGFQMGKSAINAGQDYIDQNVGRPHTQACTLPSKQTNTITPSSTAT